ncbi:MAG: lactate utilization protein [Bacteroidia bacterium]|nr:lactate utilization protein [Bacteroidia bacterium]MBT8268094.1 lactate utilization protein [Bacteroidia bacterium]NNF83259.1 LUD domain-containing protein [Flavobacteriaceae bacterium]NNK71311.1 LUD domain-containing protein [Flavobacteriaceae bacterium]NNL79265.1 LUD domain-containing protein [Flavobacteriaceae bacterium]
MSLFRKIFGSKSSESRERSNIEERSKYMPEIELPIDERFTINFKANGGKFLYCENQSEVEENFMNILNENQWQGKPVMILDNRLEDRFKSFDLEITKRNSQAAFFFTTCEYLIGNDGSLLISSNQIAEKKLRELPANFVIFATTSQFVETISEGLHGIKDKNRDKIPTNITTIKHFKPSNKDDDFLSYGSSTKNLYLLLLEDL